MAMTMPELGKALEDLTRAFKQGKIESGTFTTDTKNLYEMMKGVKEVFNVQNFITGEPNGEDKKDITPSGLKNMVQKGAANEPVTIFADELKVFEEGKRYHVSVSFKALSYILPPFVRAVCTKGSKELAKKEKQLIPTRTSGSLTLNFVYENPSNDEQIILKFIVGHAGSIANGEIEWSGFKIERVEKVFSDEQKQAAVSAIDEHLKKIEKYKNVIRNKNGAIVVPDTTEDTEAVNLKTVKEIVKESITALSDGAPEGFGTLKELAEALKNNESGISAINTALENRYTKEESDAKFIKKEQGKGLSTNDFSTAEKEKLKELQNYDDSTLKKRVDGHDTALADCYTKEQADEKITDAIKAIPKASKNAAGLTQLMVNQPTKNECTKDNPFAVTPKWVYNLLMGNTSNDLKEEITKKLKERVTSGSHDFCHRGEVKSNDIDIVTASGMYTVKYSGKTGALLVFNVGGSVGIIQFLKDSYSGNVPWKYRNAIDSNIGSWTNWHTVLTKENFKLSGTTLEITL